jgi:hypothetical protein
VEIPADAPAGVYWPHVGLYDFETISALPVSTPDGAPLGDTVTLPAIKVVPPPPAPPQQEAGARFEDLAELWGYDLTLPAAGLRAGDSLSLTLYYRSLAPTAAGYTRFVHLVGPAGEVVAQADAPPQNGLNPTWSWVPGEVIVDPVALTLAPEAAPGEYQLLVGLYDAGAGGLRLTVFDRDGQPRPDGAWPLQTLTVGP